MPTIIIIEDNENIRFEISEYFKKNSFQTICPVHYQNVIDLAKRADVCK